MREVISKISLTNIMQNIKNKIIIMHKNNKRKIQIHSSEIILKLKSKYRNSFGVPERSLLSIRRRSESAQKSLPSLLSSAKAIGLLKPLKKRTSRSVPSKAARSILGDLSWRLVKYIYLKITGESKKSTEQSRQTEFSESNFTDLKKEKSISREI